MCGVCDALACGYGKLSRLLLSNDAVYLSMVIAAQRSKIPYDDTMPKGKCRPWALQCSKQILHAPEFEFPAAVLMYYFGIKLANDINNGSLSSRVLFALCRSKIRKAEKRLHEFGLKVLPAEVSMDQQHRLEAEKGQNLDHYLRLIEKQCSEIFSQAAMLGGVPDNFHHLGEVGRHIGRLTLLLDSYVDLESDQEKGKFNIYGASLPQKTNLGAKSMEMLRNQLDESLAAIRRSMENVKLQRFEDSLSYVITDGLHNRIGRLATEAKTFGVKPVLFSVLPILIPMIIGNVLTSSSSSDCCDGGGSSDCCGDSDCSSTSSTGVGLSSSIMNRVTESTTGAAIGTGIGLAAPSVLSKLAGKGGENPPEEPTPVEETRPEPPSSGVISPAEIDGIVDWGIKHNRPPGDIQQDLNQRDKGLGGSGNVGLAPGKAPVTVLTKNGPATATPSEAGEYASAKETLERINNQSEGIRNDMAKIENDVRKWVALEQDYLRGYVGATQPFVEYENYQKRLAQIDKKYGGVMSDDYARERAQATSDFVDLVGEMSGRQPLPGREATPGREKSWLTKPSVKLDQLNAKQDSCIEQLRELQSRKQDALAKMRTLEERARQGGS